MKTWLVLGASGAIAVAAAQGCGSSGVTGFPTGSGGTAASGSSSSGGSSSGTGGSSTGGSSTGGTGGATGSTTSSGTTSSSGAASSSSSASSAASSSTGGAPCPDELGAYKVMTMGAGCGDLAAGAPQCITAGGGVCQIQLVSQGPAGSALNGTVKLDMNGDFTGGAIKEGTVQRTGCTGMWDAATSQLTVDCGGMGSSQSCVATLTRTGNTCAGSSSSSSSGGAACPDELGAYSVTTMGAGCGDLLPSAPQCIKAGSSPCQISLVSVGPTGSALNGTVTLDMNGAFSGGAIKEGTVQRTGCTGTWDAATSQLKVDCGGVGTSQSCVATLTRTGNTCP